MALYRPTPTCIWCGEIIAKGIYLDQSNIPMMFRKIGDTFLRWEYFDHKCDPNKLTEEQKKFLQEMKESNESFKEEIKKIQNQLKNGK